MFRNYSSLVTFLSLTVKAHVHSVTHGQLRKSQHTHIRTAGHSRSFKVIVIGVSRNPERGVVTMYTKRGPYFWENCKFVDFNRPTLV